jgi:3-oxoacyl-[acyl-carrier protein] reductase
VNVSSYSVKQPLDNMMLSNSLRLAVLGWSKTLATEVAGDGITVNTVCPGWTLTDRVISLLQARANETGLDEQAVQAGIESSIPAGRLADPAEIAAGIVFLASMAAGYITGTALPIDGGAARTY